MRIYDDGGRMLSSSCNNGVSETQAYNNDNTLASISFSGAAIGDLSYTWDANKNKTTESITGVLSGYGFSIPTSGYDAEDRLVVYQRNDNNLNHCWNLSLVGDWSSVTTNAATQPRTHGPTHEILTAGSDSITHDAKGNITAKPSNLDPAFTSTLQWDFDNRLMSMDVNEDSTADATFKYDALGRWVQKNSTVYALTGRQVIAEYSGSTAASSLTEQYVFASYIDEPVLKAGTGGLVYYHRNQQYSIVALPNSIGVVDRYSYDAYGKLAVKYASGAAIASSTVGNSIAYTGRNFDLETGDYHDRAR